MFAIAVFLLFAVQVVGADNWCMFEITVRSSSDERLADIPVGLYAKDGHSLAETKSDSNGVARFCDAPWSALVEVRVGPLTTPACGAVRVGYIYPLWKRTRKVAVVYEKCHLPELYFARGCQILFRIRDSNGKPLSEATVNAIETNPAVTGISDERGRVAIELNRGQTYFLEVQRTGFRRTTEKIYCGFGPNVEREEILTIRRSVD